MHKLTLQTHQAETESLFLQGGTNPWTTVSSFIMVHNYFLFFTQVINSCFPSISIICNQSSSSLAKTWSPLYFFFSVVLFSFHYSLIYKQQECTTENKQKKIRFQEDAWIWKAKISSLRKRRTAFWSLLDVIDKNIRKKKSNKEKTTNLPNASSSFFFPWVPVGH